MDRRGAKPIEGIVKRIVIRSSWNIQYEISEGDRTVTRGESDLTRASPIIEEPVVPKTVLVKTKFEDVITDIDKMVLYKLKEAAEMLKIDEYKLRMKAHSGEIDYIRIGGKMMFLDYHLGEFAKKNEIINC